MTNLTVSALNSATVVVQNKTTVKKIPTPLDVQPKGFKARVAGFFQKKQVEQLANNPIIKEEAAPKVKEEEPKKLELTEKAVQVQKSLKDTTCSTFNKLKKLLPIPKSAAPIINMLLGKTTKYGVKVEVANNSLTFNTKVKMPGQGIKGSVIVDVPFSTEKEDEVTELHPVIVNQLGKALNPLLSGEEQVQEIIKLLSTVPSQNLSLSWKDGFIRIDISLPKGVSVVLNLKLPTSAEAAQKGATPDILRTFLESILKENYAGIETLLSQSMTLTWDGSTSRFDLEFADQLELKINDFSEPAISNKILKKLVEGISRGAIVTIPKNIRGTIDFKNPSIQFDKGTTFSINKGLIPNVTINRVSYDPTNKKLHLSLESTSKVLQKMFGKKINNLEIDLEKLTGTGIDSKELTEEKKPTKDDAIQKKPNNVNFEFTNYNTKKVAPPAEIKAAEGPKPIISAFETIKNMVKLPASVASLIDIFFADQTKLDVSVKDVKDNFTVSVDNLNIPKLGLFGKASLSIPTEAQKTVDEPVKLHPEIEDAINKLLANQLKPKSTEEAALFSNLIDLALTLPNQNMHIMWQGNLGIADLVLTLPGGMKLTLELEINKIESGKDLLRTKLSEILGNQFADIEPLLGQTFKFKWNGETKEFKIEFLEQQEISLKSIKLKKGGFFQNMLRKFVNWITKGSAIRLPKEIRGKVDFENASVSFEKGSTFTVRGPLGISKKIGIRRVSFGEKNMVGIGLRCFGTQSINIDTRTSNVDSARVGIHPVSSVKNHQ